MTETIYRITQIEPQKRDDSRVNIYLDDAFAFGLEKEVVLKYDLYEGKELMESLIDDVLLSEEKTRAKNKSLAFLSHRSYSIEELKQKLAKKGFSGRTIDRVVQDLGRVGLLNDRAFAFSYAESRMIQRPMAKRLLKQELLSKGIDDATASQAVEEAYAGRTEEEVARSLIRKRMEGSGDSVEKRVKKKLSDFLFRRGFGWEVTSSVILGKALEMEE